MPALVMVAAFVVVIAGAMASASILNPILLSLFISIVCAQPILWMNNKGVPHGVAVVIVLMGILAIFFGLGAILGNTINSFADDAPGYTVKLRELLDGTIQNLNERGFNISREKWDGTINPGKVLNYTANILTEFGSFMSNALLIFFIVTFMLFERGSLRLKATVIADSYDNNLNVLANIVDSIRNYLGLKTIISLITGIFIWLWLLVFGVEYAILWGLIAFLLNYIPNIGSIIAGIPAVLFALVQSGLVGAGWTILGYLVVNMVVGNIVEPRLMGKEMGLSTLIVFISLLFWGFVLGTIGMFLAVPLTMTFKIILNRDPKTQWIAILLGGDEHAREILDRSLMPEEEGPEEAT